VEAQTTEYINGVAQKRTELFRAYGSYAESIKDYASLLQNSPRYAPLFAQQLDAGGFARGLQQAGYASDPMYAAKLARVINSDVLRQALS
jgi:flagellar protein FlgJ